jgi:CheY-like chemotaxis protein
VRPSLTGTDVLIVSASEVSASLTVRQLTDWGARACLVGSEQNARSLLSGRAWKAILVDHAVGRDTCERLAQTASAIERRVVLITPSERDQIAALRQAGFTGYLIKPVRRDSLAIQMAGGAEPDFAVPENSPGPAQTAISPAATRGLAVLVAEDNEINALLVQSLLARLGHRPTVVSSGQAALAAYCAAQAAENPYDLLLMDLQMPDGDGIETVHRIRAVEAEARGRRLPIFAVTANAYEEDRAAALAAGMDGILVKPLERRALVDVLFRIGAALSSAA